MKKNIIFPCLLATALLISIFSFTEISHGNETDQDLTIGAENAGLTLPSGFSASIIANNLGGVRHIAITKEGDLYAKLARAKGGKGILFLKNTNGNFAEQNGFGDYGGTAMRIHDGYLYASSNTDVYRYKLNSKDEVTDPSNPEKIITGLLDRGEHNSKSVTFDHSGNIYVNIGAYSNSCQVEDRTPGSMGRPGCPILDSAGGIWQFKTDKKDQHYGDGVHYAMGLRNVVGLDWNQKDNALFVMQHGRDQLHDLFPQYYTEKESAVLPAECMYEIHQGDNAGWPYIYYDQIQKKQILMPEYGGNGKKTADKKYLDPVMAFPGHLAPNDFLFYTGNQFPEKYKNGAFIAFHGSWNRTPEPQAGYFVVFVPFKDGKPTGKWEVFADGFSGSKDLSSPGKAAHRPCGLAQGPDGSLYVSDDVKGTIYKIVYNKK
ncbi:MAG TPA: PQQ-dependent sugar dehydrogenase [Hanamia sp.]